jgi:hypothetical protein
MALTNNADQVTQALVDLLEANPSLGLRKVYYGDQTRIGLTPCAAVDTGPTDQEIAGTGYYAAITFNVSIMVYYASVKSDTELARESNQFAQEVMNVIHTEPMKNLNGLIINGLVTRNEPGTAIRAGAKLRAHRLTWRGTSRAHL